MSRLYLGLPYQVQHDTNFPLIASFLASFADCKSPPTKKEIQVGRTLLL